MLDLGQGVPAAGISRRSQVTPLLRGRVLGCSGWKEGIMPGVATSSTLMSPSVSRKAER